MKKQTNSLQKHFIDNNRINLELKETAFKIRNKITDEKGYEMTFEDKTQNRQPASLKTSCSSSPGSSSQIVEDNPCEDESFESNEDRKPEHEYDLSTSAFQTKKSRHICEDCLEALECKSRMRDAIDNEKLDQLLNDVYTSQFREISARKIDIGHYEKLVMTCDIIQYFSVQKDRETNISLVKQLAHKLSKKIKKMKDTVYENTEVKALIDNFMKSSHDTKRKNCINCNASIPSTCHHEDLKNIIKLMILELKKIYSAVIGASSDLEIIFKGPLSHLTGEDESIYEKFQFEDIQREEFCKWVYKDDFIKTIIFQMKRKILNFEDISELITAVEIDLNQGKKEMTRLERCIAIELKKIGQEKEIFKDIDDLVRYINGKEDDTKPKKIKKKSNHRKITNRNVNSNNNNNNTITPTTTATAEHQDTMVQIDNEIEEFKNSLSVTSIPAFSIRKIRPHISKEWITSLSLKKSVNNV